MPRRPAPGMLNSSERYASSGFLALWAHRRISSCALSDHRVEQHAQSRAPFTGKNRVSAVLLLQAPIHAHAVRHAPLHWPLFSVQVMPARAKRISQFIHALNFRIASLFVADWRRFRAWNPTASLHNGPRPANNGRTQRVGALGGTGLALMPNRRDTESSQLLEDPSHAALGIPVEARQHRSGGNSEPHNDRHNGDAAADDVTRAKRLLDNGLSG